MLGDIWNIYVVLELKIEMRYMGALRKKVTVHQVTTMLATSKNVLFLGHSHLLTTGADDPTLWVLLDRQQGDN